MSGPLTPGEVLVVPDKTNLDQRRAADPRASAWVSANAGAGKTKVLTDRVLRLLLDGAPPGRILCLTFTKAAAATMAIRVFERLGAWVALDDGTLARELARLDGAEPDAARLRLARRLFARAVETPGGLKIETIHAFCERILHLAPFEANVPARFAVLDDAQAAELLEEATRETLARAASGDAGLRRALERVSLEATGEALIKVLREALRWREAILDEEALASTLARLREALRLPEGMTAEAVERSMVEGGIPVGDWAALAQTLGASPKKNDQDRAASLRDALAAGETPERLRHYRLVFFTNAGEPRSEKLIVTGSVDPALKARLLDEQRRLEGLDERLRAANALERTAALLTLGHAIRARVEAGKVRRGALDFDDLIRRTLALLRREGEAAWILYKLDRGIDHVLVDEAQDTNPDQWEILRRITEDFCAGEGARQVTPRTLFAVGDPKQSIYGFQGAAPAEFEASRGHWERKVRAVDLAFEDVRLDLSFRSARGVLDAVDATFAVEAHFKGLSFETGVVGTAHVSARRDAPGLVEMWPVERPAPAEEPEAWVLPLDEPDQQSPAVRLARRVARAIRHWTTEPDALGRVWRPGDVLVLVRKRGTAFEAVIRALKDAKVPVAGADRIDIGEHIAVMDLVAIGRAALLPDDDLTLATALKTPLVGLTDDDLTDIAADRPFGEPLRDALVRHAGLGHRAALAGVEALQGWRELAARHGPFGFYAWLLGPGGGRRRLVARLGSEAGDAIDAFLCLAHTAGVMGVPSLNTFLARFETADHEVKRDLAAVRDDVRVMTVHGAKGLEAPVVVLIDGCDVGGRDGALLRLEDGLPVWAPGRNSDPGAVEAARTLARQRGLEEHNRLLYVAMTRAKDRLVIAPYSGHDRETAAEAWCEMIRRGFAHRQLALVHETAPYGPVERFRDGAAAAAPATAEAAPPDVVAVPDWLVTPADPEPEPAPPLRPSGPLAAADRPARPADGPFAREARLRGSLVHALLERLPEVDPLRRAQAAAAYLQARAPRLPGETREAIAADALRVLARPELAGLFGPGSRAEVPVAGRVRLPGMGEPSPVSGQIDRLVVLEDEVLVLDFKTSAKAPSPDAAAPRAYVLQLALYRALLAEIYPRHRVRAFLVWTAGPHVRELTRDEMDEALAAVTAA